LFSPAAARYFMAIARKRRDFVNMLTISLLPGEPCVISRNFQCAGNDTPSVDRLCGHRSAPSSKRRRSSPSPPSRLTPWRHGVATSQRHAPMPGRPLDVNTCESPRTMISCRLTPSATASWCSRSQLYNAQEWGPTRGKPPYVARSPSQQCTRPAQQPGSSHGPRPLAATPGRPASAQRHSIAGYGILP